MTLLEKVRRVYAAIVARRNGHAKPQHGYAVNAVNAESPPPAGPWLADDLTAEDAWTPFDEPEREVGEEG